MFLYGAGTGKGSGAGCGYPEAKPSTFLENDEILSHQILLEILILPQKPNISIVKNVFSSESDNNDNSN